MKNLHSLEEQERQYWENLKKRIASAFPKVGTTEDNLKSGDQVYRFNAECYRDTAKAIKIGHDIWLPKSQIKIVWGERQIDYVV
jgi:hypothetical protein